MIENQINSKENGIKFKRFSIIILIIVCIIGVNINNNSNLQFANGNSIEQIAEEFVSVEDLKDSLYGELVLQSKSSEAAKDVLLSMDETGADEFSVSKDGVDYEIKGNIIVATQDQRSLYLDDEVQFIVDGDELKYFGDSEQKVGDLLNKLTPSNDVLNDEAALEAKMNELLRLNENTYKEVDIDYQDETLDVAGDEPVLKSRTELKHYKTIASFKILWNWLNVIKQAWWNGVESAAISAAAVVVLAAIAMVPQTGAASLAAGFISFKIILGLVKAKGWALRFGYIAIKTLWSSISRFGFVARVFRSDEWYNSASNEYLRNYRVDAYRVYSRWFKWKANPHKHYFNNAVSGLV